MSSGPDGLDLKPSVRDKTLWDILGHWKTRYLLVVWTPIILALVVIAVASGASAPVLIGGAAYGIVLYSLIEYLMHRYLYHWEPQSRFWRTVTADVGRKHMRHHREPDRLDGAINDRQLPILIVAGILTLGAVLMPWPLAFGLMSIAAGAANYVVQEIVHFGTHHHPMRHPILAALKRHHMLHHYRDWDMNFGLFWPFWDIILGTHHTSRRRKARRVATPSRSRAPG